MWSGVWKSNTPRFETTRGTSWKRVAPAPAAAARGVAHAADHVDLLHEGAHGVVGHPVAGGVVDRVARRAPYTDELHLGLGVRPDGRDVLVARAVDLARHHHHVAPARPHDVEDAAVGHVRLTDEVGRAGGDGRRPDHERGLAVGEHDVGREGQLGQPGAECGDGAEGAHHDLTRLAPDLGAGDDAGLGPGDADVGCGVALMPAAPPRAPCTRRHRRTRSAKRMPPTRQGRWPRRRTPSGTSRRARSRVGWR